MARRSDGPRGSARRAPERAPFFFEGIESPNGTIFPDVLLDLVMPFLSPTEWKVCSYIVRRTFGWKKASDRISLEQICHGIVRRDGSRLDYGTQLDRKTAIKALRGLEAKGVIVAQRNYSEARGFEATTYGLRFRGQPPTRTLVEKLPQGAAAPGETLHLGEGECSHQADGSAPPPLVAAGHPQPPDRTTQQPADRQPAQIPASPPSPGPADAEGGSCPGPEVALWAAVLAQLRQQMTPANFETWLAETRPLGRRGPVLVVAAPSGFVRDWLQQRLRPLVLRALRDQAPELADVVFTVAAPR
jgi:hypothetical protein